MNDMELKEYLQIDSSWDQFAKAGQDGGCIYIAARELYKATKAHDYIDFLLRHPEDTNSLLFLYEKNQSKEMMQRIEELRDKLIRPENLEFSPNNLKEMFQIMPFYMTCETKFGRKEKYNDIIFQFKKVANLIYDKKSGIKHNISLEDTMWFLLAVIFTMDVMSIEIFEHYKTLERIVKEIIAILLSQEDEKEQISSLDALAYVILKACQMSILSREKYQIVGEGILHNSTVKSSLQDKKDTSKNYGIKLMAYAQMLLLKLEEENNIFQIIGQKE